MKTELTGGGVLALALIGAGVGLYLWKGKAIADTAAKAVDWVNPVSTQNLLYQSVNTLVPKTVGASGQASEESLGTWLAELFSPSVKAANDSLKAPALMPPGTDYQSDMARETRSLIGRYGTDPQAAVRNGGADWTSTDPFAVDPPFWAFA